MGAREWAALGVLVGLVLAVWWGRRSGKRLYSTAITAAEARGGAAVAEGLRAQLGQSVNVSVPVQLGGQSFGPGELSRHDLARIAADYDGPADDDSADYGPAWTVDDPRAGLLGPARGLAAHRGITAGAGHRSIGGLGSGRSGEALSDAELEGVNEALRRLDGGPFDD